MTNLKGLDDERSTSRDAEHAFVVGAARHGAGPGRVAVAREFSAYR